MIEYVCRWCGEGYGDLSHPELVAAHRLCNSALVLEADRCESFEELLVDAEASEALRS